MAGLRNSAGLHWRWAAAGQFSEPTRSRLSGGILTHLCHTSHANSLSPLSAFLSSRRPGVGQRPVAVRTAAGRRSPATSGRRCRAGCSTEPPRAAGRGARTRGPRSTLTGDVVDQESVRQSGDPPRIEPVAGTALEVGAIRQASGDSRPRSVAARRSSPANPPGGVLCLAVGCPSVSDTFAVGNGRRSARGHRPAV
jgi:hypothetical protein